MTDRTAPDDAGLVAELNDLLQRLESAERRAMEAAERLRRG